MQSNFSVYDLSIIKDVRELSIILGIVMRFSDCYHSHYMECENFIQDILIPLSEKWPEVRWSLQNNKIIVLYMHLIS